MVRLSPRQAASSLKAIFAHCLPLYHLPSTYAHCHLLFAHFPNTHTLLSSLTSLPPSLHNACSKPSLPWDVPWDTCWGSAGTPPSQTGGHAGRWRGGGWWAWAGGRRQARQSLLSSPPPPPSFSPLLSSLTARALHCTCLPALPPALPPAHSACPLLGEACGSLYLLPGRRRRRRRRWGRGRGRHNKNKNDDDDRHLRFDDDDIP